MADLSKPIAIMKERSKTERLMAKETIKINSGPIQESGKMIKDLELESKYSKGGKSSILDDSLTIGITDKEKWWKRNLLIREALKREFLRVRE